MQRYKVTIDLSDVFVTSPKPENDLATELTEEMHRFLHNVRLYISKAEYHEDSVQLDLEPQSED